jgi:hypothetical protein
VAIFHLTVKAISRSAGRSATAAAAYRAGEKIVDARTGEIHDYTKKRGVESADIVLPDGAPEWANDRSQLWNAAELAEKRKDACVAREFEVALPSELSKDERRQLALDFARDMASREGCAVDVAIHAPGKGGDNRNHHAHILRTTRKVEADGLGAKLDTEQAGRKRKDDLEQVRERWAAMANEALERAGQSARIDHRSLEAQGIEREPTQHLGPAASGYERRTREPSYKRAQQAQEATNRLMAAKEAGEQWHAVDRGITILTGEIQGEKSTRSMIEGFERAEAARKAARAAEEAKPPNPPPEPQKRPDEPVIHVYTPEQAVMLAAVERKLRESGMQPEKVKATMEIFAAKVARDNPKVTLPKVADRSAIPQPTAAEPKPQTKQQDLDR